MALVPALTEPPYPPIVIHVDETRSTPSGLTCSMPVADVVSPAKLDVRCHRLSNVGKRCGDDPSSDGAGSPLEAQMSSIPSLVPRDRYAARCIVTEEVPGQNEQEQIHSCPDFTLLLPAAGWPWLG